MSLLVFFRKLVGGGGAPASAPGYARLTDRLVYGATLADRATGTTLANAPAYAATIVDRSSLTLLSDRAAYGATLEDREP